MLRLEGVELAQRGFTLRADWALKAPGRVAVIGPSGAGKSTLLDLIAGFRLPDRGRVRIGGRDVTQAAPGDRPVAMLFQDNNLFPHLTLAQNLGLALRPRGGRLTAVNRKEIVNALEAVGLGDMADRRPGTLSGGQQSRGALARVLVQARPVILLDEPFAALGPALRDDMLARVSALSDQLGALTLLVTHAPDEARRFAQQTVLVADGMAHPPQDTALLLDNPPPALRDYLGDGAARNGH